MVLAVAIATAFGACKKPRDPADPAEMKEKLAKQVKMLWWKVDASDGQKEQVDRLLDGIAPDLFAMQEETKALTRGLIDAMDADPVDVVRVDRLRAEATALFGRYLERMQRGLVDFAGILTVDQRRELVGLWRRYENGD